MEFSGSGGLRRRFGAEVLEKGLGLSLWVQEAQNDINLSAVQKRHFGSL